MSKRDTFLRNAKCPFFQSGYHSGIRCEGIVPGTYIRTVFKSDRKMEHHFNSYCAQAKGCEKCPVYIAKAGKPGDL